ncbi:hypothetical protein DVH05_027363 [Phytophthora capsici]|nr:hypothetical protein DVH05_027363 [Phytophthora capsici]
MKVPPNATSVCQPAEVAWNYPFKCGLRQCWLKDLQEKLERPQEEGAKFKLAPPGRSGMCRWIRSSWDGLSAQTIANGYRKCDLQLDDDCLAAASLVGQLEQLSLVGSAVDADQDFGRIIEEAVV